MNSTQSQDKTHHTHQQSPPLLQENPMIEAPERQDHPSNGRVVEKQSDSEGTDQCENGEKEDEKMEVLQQGVADEKPMTSNGGVMKERETEVVVMGPRERLKRHRTEVAGQVWIPDMWGQEDLLKDWIDCSAFDSSLVPQGIMSARASLIQEGRTANSGRLRVENSC